jgi:hypothetical protein
MEADADDDLAEPRWSLEVPNLDADDDLAEPRWVDASLVEAVEDVSASRPAAAPNAAPTAATAAAPTAARGEGARLLQSLGRFAPIVDAPPGGGRSTRRSASTAGVSAPPTAPLVGAAQALAVAVDKIPLAVAVDEIALAVAVDTAHPPPDSTPLTSANAVGRRVRVPAFCWPTYPCLEHGGLGWTGCIIALKRSKRSKAATVQVRFTEAADERGVPYADVELKLAVLKPF